MEQKQQTNGFISNQNSKQSIRITVKIGCICQVKILIQIIETKHKHQMIPNKQLKQFKIQAATFILFTLISQVIIIQSIYLRRHPFFKYFILTMIGFIYAIITNGEMGSSSKSRQSYFVHVILPPIIFTAGYCLRKTLNSYVGRIKILATQLIVIGLAFFFVCSLFYEKTYHILTLKSVLLILISPIIAYFAYFSFKQPQLYPLLHSIIYGQGCIQQILFILTHEAISNNDFSKRSKLLKKITKIFSPLQLDFSSLVRIVLWGVFAELVINWLFISTRQKSKWSLFLNTIFILLIEYSIYLLFVFSNESGIIPLFVCSFVIGRHAFISRFTDQNYSIGFSFQDVTNFFEICLYLYLGALIFKLQNNLAVIIYLFFSLFNTLVKRNRLIFGQTQFSQEFFEAVLPNLKGETQDQICYRKWEFQVNKQWKEMMKCIKKTNVFEFQANCQEAQLTDRIQTLKCILHVEFTHLKVLCLNSNRIQSIEGICNLSLNTLQSAYFAQNFITYLKPFNKIIWPSLKMIQLSDNKLKQVSAYRAYIFSLDYCSFECQNESSIQVNDPKILVKFSCQKIVQLLLNNIHKDVIYCQKVYQSLKRRFLDIAIYWGNQRQQFFDD